MRLDEYLILARRQKIPDYWFFDENKRHASANHLFTRSELIANGCSRL
jgi:hypothetical protein